MKLGIVSRRPGTAINRDEHSWRIDHVNPVGEVTTIGRVIDARLAVNWRTPARVRWVPVLFADNRMLRPHGSLREAIEALVKERARHLATSSSRPGRQTTDAGEAMPLLPDAAQPTGGPAPTSRLTGGCDAE